MNEQILAGKKYRVLADEATGLWNRISFWNKASDTELESGKTVEEAFADVPGLSDTFTPGAAIPRDADTLGGQYSASDITTLTNNLRNFSDYYNDVEIGTFNGKKVYRRYIETVATIPPSGSVKVGTFEKGVNKILDIKVIAYDSVNNYAFPLGSYLHIQIEGTDMNVFQSMSAGSLSNFTLKIYIIYTD